MCARKIFQKVAIVVCRGEHCSPVEFSIFPWNHSVFKVCGQIAIRPLRACQFLADFIDIPRADG